VSRHARGYSSAVDAAFYFQNVASAAGKMDFPQWKSTDHFAGRKTVLAFAFSSVKIADSFQQ
jgi:hypothetical protein